MGYQAPSIDRIAENGMEFTDCYGHTRIPERMCWSFRASKVGLPGAEQGCQKTGVAIAGQICPFRL